MNIPFSISNSWIVVGVGATVWFISASIHPKNHNKQDINKTPLFTRILAIVGLAILLAGIYAGLAGPVNIGPFTLDSFEFTESKKTTDAETLKYIRKHLIVSSKAAHSWHGSSKKTIQYTVRNNGPKKISYLYLRFYNSQGFDPIYTDVKLRGPFPPGRTKKANVTVSAKVKSSYFDHNPAIGVGHIIGAGF
ncbi:MAG: hypothetical protein JXN60_08525 [Lentisphaerae bacterium]|nr:hypothetical protein [Lentisphaerota bacterium]